MRLLNVSLTNFLFYSLILVLIGIPVSFIAIQDILHKEVDDALHIHNTQFINHIKGYEYLEDLEVDLRVFDAIAYDTEVTPDSVFQSGETYRTVTLYDSLDDEVKPFREIISYVKLKDKPYRVTNRMSLVENDELIYVIGVVQAILILLLAGGLILINRTLSKKLWKPFYSTVNKLRAYQLDKNDSFQYEETKISEFDDLNNAIRLLTDRNKQVFQQQTEFIENASHELQTPLSILQSKLDMLMQSEHLTEQQASLIKDLIETIQRLARLNKSLLLLSKIENEQFIEKENVDVSKIVNDSISNFKMLTEGSFIKTQTEIQPFSVYGNRTLLEILINNLLRNAYQHNISNGEIKVSLLDQKLEIKNTGERLRKTSGQIFDRFTKDSNRADSIGLGLAIVKKICDLAGYKIEYTYEDGFHNFSISMSPQPLG